MPRGRPAPAAADVPRGRAPIGLRERPPARAHLLPAASDQRCRRPTGRLPPRPWMLGISRARDALGYVPAWTAFDGPLHDPVLEVRLVPAGGARARRA